jgi:hypothetical protein
MKISDLIKFSEEEKMQFLKKNGYQIFWETVKYSTATYSNKTIAEEIQMWVVYENGEKVFRPLDYHVNSWIDNAFEYLAKEKLKNIIFQ